jgi:hypothetical protein
MGEITELEFATWLEQTIHRLRTDPILLENEFAADAYYDAHEDALVNAQAKGEFAAFEALGAPIARYACCPKEFVENVKRLVLSKLEAALETLGRVPDEHKSAPIDCQTAYSAFTGNGRISNPSQWLKRLAAAGTIHYEKIPGSKLVYVDVRDFPQSARERLATTS